jgi:hypothetical protein
MATVVRDRVTFGFSAYRALAWRVPAFWLLLPVLYVPGVRYVGDGVYRRVSAGRHASCSVDAMPTPVADDVARVHLRGATACLGLAAFLLSWWMTHVEFYPFTSMRMFSEMNEPSGHVRYVKPLAIGEDGRVGPARFERWIGAMADTRYRRVILMPFDAAGRVDRANEFFAASMHVANRQASPGDRVVGFELQLWEWDFAADASNPAHGDLVAVYRYDPVELGKLGDRGSEAGSLVRWLPR